MTPGLAYYGLQAPSWPLSQSFKAFDGIGSIRLSILYNSFGAEFSNLSPFLADPRPLAIEIHLINEVGHRNHRLGTYEFLYPYTLAEYCAKLARHDPALYKRMGDYIGPVVDLVHAHKNVHWYISPGLESNITAPAATVLLSFLRSRFPPGVKFVWCPVGQGRHRVSGYDFAESHGAYAGGLPPWIANLDGSDVGTVDARAWLARTSNAQLQFLWSASMNGIEPGAFKDPRKRTAWPDQDMFTRCNNLLRV